MNLPVWKLRRRKGRKSRESQRLRTLRVELLEDRRLLDGAVGQQAIELFSVSPALFVENQGQWADESVRFVHQGDGVNVAMTDAGPVFQLFQREEEKGDGALFPGEVLQGSIRPEGKSAPSAFSLAEFSVSFDGANRVEPVGSDRVETVYNYYVGEQSNWRSGVPSYETVAYMDLYDGIDLYTCGQRDSLKYEFQVAPGADYRQIQVRYQGIDGLWLDDAGAMHVETALGELIDDAPYIYQQIDGRQVHVAGRFELIDDDSYTFVVTDDYDPAKELILDPDLAWSTYLGGSDYDYRYDIAVDASGNVLVTGGTYSSGWITGGYDTTLNGLNDGFVAKLTPNGALLWSTYLGGSDEDYGYGIAVAPSGNVLVTGETKSSGWITGGYDTTHNGSSDAFVAKLTPNGARLWSTYLGGSDSDYGYGIAVDPFGNVLVTGYTDSSGWITGGYDTTYNGSYDAFVAKLSRIGMPLWSTYLGGSADDHGSGIAVDPAGNVLVTGRTHSSGWITGGYDTIYNGGGDAFVAKLTPNGARLWSTYLGGSDSEYGRGIAVDPSGNVLVTGSTGSSGWITGGYDTIYNGGGDAFVAKLTPDGAHLWSTYLGGSDWDSGYGIAVDPAGNVLVTGGTRSSGWITGGYNTTRNGGSDAFVAKLTPNGARLSSTYLGGSADDHGSDIAVDPSGYVLVTGYTYSSGWITGGYDTTYNSARDAFVAKIEVPVYKVPVYWDERGNGEWHEIDAETGYSRWVDADGNPLGVYPDGFTYAVIRTDTVTVIGDFAVYRLTVENAAILVGPGSTLTVAAHVRFALDAQYISQFDGTANGTIVTAGEIHLAGTLTFQPVGVAGAVLGATKTSTIVGTTGDGGIIGTFGDLPLASGPESHLGIGVFYRGMDYVSRVEPEDPATGVSVNLFFGRGGDGNGDGYVDVQDINTLVANFGADPGNMDWTDGDTAGGDANRGDGYVDVQDINILVANFGIAPSPDPGPAAAATATAEEDSSPAAFTADALFTSLAWIEQFEQTEAQSRPSQKGSPAADAVDVLLASYGG